MNFSIKLSILKSNPAWEPQGPNFYVCRGQNLGVELQNAEYGKVFRVVDGSSLSILQDWRPLED